MMGNDNEIARNTKYSAKDFVVAVVGVKTKAIGLTKHLQVT